MTVYCFSQPGLVKAEMNRIILVLTCLSGEAEVFGEGRTGKET